MNISHHTGWVACRLLLVCSWLSVVCGAAIVRWLELLTVSLRIWRWSSSIKHTIQSLAIICETPHTGCWESPVSQLNMTQPILVADDHSAHQLWYAHNVIIYKENYSKPVGLYLFILSAVLALLWSTTHYVLTVIVWSYIVLETTRNNIMCHIIHHSVLHAA